MSREEKRALKTLARLLRLCDRIDQIVGVGRAAYEREGAWPWAGTLALTALGDHVAELPESIREEFSGQPWQDIIDLRTLPADKDSVDEVMAGRVWTMLTESVPPLRSYVEDVMMPELRRRTGRR